MKFAAWADEALADIIIATDDLMEAKAAEDGEADVDAQHRWVAAHKTLTKAVERLAELEDEHALRTSKRPVMVRDLWGQE